ncbi:hypothetical protein EC968_002267 [Mortierella alpina]|nr:hypothetical protein EC968_002267 [Mortierella alpina]
MARSATRIFFATPELFSLLSTHLLKPDLAQCSLVCKEWSRQFQPLLWTDLNFNKRFIERLNATPSPTTTALLKNRGHIRKVEFQYLNQPQLQLLFQGHPDQLGDSVEEPGTLCTNLTRIDIKDLGSDNLDLISEPLVKLLRHNTRLTYLHVPCDIFEIDGVAEALSKLRHLQHLSIDALYEPIFPEPLVFLRSCLVLPELTELIIDVEMRWYNGDKAITIQELEATITEAAATRFSQSTNAKRIKSMQFPSAYGSRNPLPLLLLRSDLLDLETCVIPRSELDADSREIEQVVRERCPNLKHLRHLGEPAEWDDPITCAFIRGCSGLWSFTSNSLTGSANGEPLPFLSELVSRHHATLEVLDITPCWVSSRDLQDVLSRCTQLKRFCVVANVSGNIPRINYRDISRNDWVCTELEELGLRLDRSRPERRASAEQGEEGEGLDDATKHVFQQIGRLKKLTKLAVSLDTRCEANATEADDALNPTLPKDWLVELAGLKYLKCLDLQGDFCLAIGQAEREFMDEHFPLLSTIIINRHPSLFRTEPQWKWRLKK